MLPGFPSRDNLVRPLGARSAPRTRDRRRHPRRLLCHSTQLERQQIKMEAPARWEPRPCVQTGGPSELGEQRSRVKGMFPKSASFKPGGQQTPPPFATACSIAAQSGCELAPRGAAFSRGGGGRGGPGSPVRPIGPGKQHPFSPPQLWVQPPLGPGHALLPPPPRAALGSAARPRSGAGGRWCLAGGSDRNYKTRKPLRQRPARLRPRLRCVSGITQ